MCCVGPIIGYFSISNRLKVVGPQIGELVSVEVSEVYLLSVILKLLYLEIRAMFQRNTSFA